MASELRDALLGCPIGLREDIKDGNSGSAGDIHIIGHRLKRMLIELEKEDQSLCC